jgi:hypothetical protein
VRAGMARALVLGGAAAVALSTAIVPASAATSSGWRVVKTFGPAEGVWSDNFAVSGAKDAWSTWIACNPCSGSNPVTDFYLEHSAGTTWKKVGVPSSLTTAAESSVAIGASSGRNLWLFEPASSSKAKRAHVLRWNGTWHRQAIPTWVLHINLSGTFNVVPAVFGPKSVWVFSTGVDAFTNPDHYVARYNGHAWSKMQMPGVANQVSILSQNDIWALGTTVATNLGDRQYAPARHERRSHRRDPQVHGVAAGWQAGEPAVRTPDSRSARNKVRARRSPCHHRADVSR